MDSSGRQIYEKGDQITVLADKRCDAKSQSREGITYRVSYGLGKFICECPYHVHGKGCRCQHIAAVEYMLLQNAESSTMETIIDGMKLKCAECGKAPGPGLLWSGAARGSMRWPRSLPVSFWAMSVAGVGAGGFAVHDAFMPVSADSLDGRFVAAQVLAGVAVLAGGVAVLRVCGPRRPVASVSGGTAERIGLV